MAEGKDGGSPTTDLLWLVGLIIVLGLAWAASGGPEQHGVPRSPFLLSPSVPSAGISAGGSGVGTGTGTGGGDGEVVSGVPVGASPYQGQIQLARGNVYADRASEEYIVLSATRRATEAISITGWTLRNGRDQLLKLNPNKSDFVNQASASATIPQGALVFDPAGRHLVGPIILNPGERAYVISGSGRSYGEYPATVSFKTNKCLGYIEDANRYDLVPRLSSWGCPQPEDELGAERLAEPCYSLIRRLPSCQAPKITRPRDADGTLVNGQSGWPTFCRQLVERELNYPSCVARHAADPDFLGEEWRVFLGARYELWASRRETISLFDNYGRLVDQLRY